MFSGIITDIGKVTMIGLDTGVFSFNTVLAKQLSVGDSIAVDGICLTVVSKDDNNVTVDVMPETIKRTNLSEIKPGTLLNLELPLTPDAFLSGHLVSGHIDTTGNVRCVEEDHNAHVLEISLADTELKRFITEKGSISINGVSLTVISIDESGAFTVGIIPHTWEKTNFHTLRKGSIVNIEVDLLARYLERLIKIDNYS